MGSEARSDFPVAAWPGAQLAAGGGLYLGGEHWLRVISYNSAADVVITIAGVLMHRDGSTSNFAHRHVPNTDRTIATSAFQLGEGWLLYCQAYASAGAPRRGQCYVGVELARGGTGAREPLGTLVKDYVAEGQGIAWPGSPVRSSTEGPGVIRSITGTDPAAGVEISETVPTNARWRLLSLVVSLVTDATVDNRHPVFVFDDGTTVYARAKATPSQTASKNWSYSLGAFGYNLDASASDVLIIGTPDLHLLGGHRIRSTTGSLKAGDNWSAPQLLVEEWIED